MQFLFAFLLVVPFQQQGVQLSDFQRDVYFATLLAAAVATGLLIGGLSGCAAGFAMTIFMSYDWPVLVGGKPIASIPPYVVIAFELTILLGALSTVAAVGLFSVLLGKRGVAYDPRFSDDHIGIFVPAGSDQTGAVETLLRSAGAVEVRREAA